MDDSAPQRQLQLDRFRSYLLLLARAHLHTRHHRRLDPSDIVQQTLLEAHQTQARFRGQSEAEMAQWLRQILVHNVADAVRSMAATKRDAKREQSLEAAIDDSMSHVCDCLFADQTSVGRRMDQDNDLLLLANYLGQLPDRQREAVALHHLEGLSVADVANNLECSEGAAAALLHRGLKQLRQLMKGTV